MKGERIMHTVNANNCIVTTNMGTKVWYPSTKFSQINRKAKYICRFQASDRQERMKSRWKQSLKDEKETKVNQLRHKIASNDEKLRLLELRLASLL